jgi:SAM-dependent methyltransferase
MSPLQDAVLLQMRLRGFAAKTVEAYIYALKELCRYYLRPLDTLSCSEVQRFLDEIGQYLPERGRVLDLGCGFGLFSLYYASVHPGLRLEGLDRNPRRIAMARAFWRDAGILILDEPSSSLDPLAEAEMLRQFRELLGGRSAIIISHRFSTVQMADNIYVMDQGRIVEQGTHAALLAANGHYARLYRTQAQPYQAR